MERPTIYNQHFGLGLSPMDLADNGLPTTPLHAGYLRLWRLFPPKQSGISRVVNTKQHFKISLDVQQFKSEELSVKVMKNYVVIKGKHGERTDEHGFISRQFTRRYRLPENVDMETIHSSLSSDGVLQVWGSKKAQLEGRTIPITKTNHSVFNNITNNTKIKLRSPITSPNLPAEKKRKKDI